MSDEGIYVVCDDLSIRYRIGDVKNIGLKEWTVRKLLGRGQVCDFWALRNISFTLRSGDMLGIIGANGAGKTTLLKAIAGVMDPSGGKVRTTGRIAPFLELASGFDGDLTVKENAYLRGAILGYTREFMDAAYRSIIRFAELEEFEDLMFRQLSSGMRARLAFSLASLVRPDILLLDEVLAVGDGAFHVKSESKFREIMENGAITLIVTHAIPKVRSLCNKVLWLNKGRMVEFTNDVAGCCDRYERFLSETYAMPPGYMGER